MGIRPRTQYEIAAYNAAYEAGQEAWVEADDDEREQEPDLDFLEGRVAEERDGFLAGWNDAMIEGSDYETPE